MFGDDSVKYKLENVYVTVDKKVANIDLTALQVSLFCVTLSLYVSLP